MTKNLSIMMLLGFASVLSVGSTRVSAIINDLESSANQRPEKAIPAWIYLTELNFKNTTADFLKFKVVTQKKEPVINLKGLQFYDDKIFKTVEQDFIVPDQSEITLTFNQNKTDSAADKQLFTTRTGLTSTTEQILLKQNNLYFDFFCWQKNPVTTTEQKDFQKIFQADFWNDSDPLSCFESEQIEKNQSVFRINSNHDSEAWAIGEKEQPEIELPDNDSTYTSQPILSPPDLSNFFPSIQAITPHTSSKKSTTSSKTTADLPNPDQPETETPVQINEIFPAPPTNEPEWIELYNSGNHPINLQNWYLDDNDGGSKPYLIENQTIEAQGYLLFNNKQTKLNLNNTGDQIRLFTPDRILADLVAYQETSKNQSYAKIMNDGEINWLWTDEISPGKDNPVFTTVTGVIISPPSFDQEQYYFQVNTLDQKTIDIIFNESLIKAPLAKTIFLKEIIGKFTGILEESKNGSGLPKLLLRKYQLDEIIPVEDNETMIPISIASIFSAVTGFYYVYRKFIAPSP